MNNRALIYCRKSTDRDDKQANSLESQLNACTKTLESNNSILVDTLLESASAKKSGGRPVFERMLTLCKKGKIDYIIVDEASRLSRNNIDSAKVLELLEEGHIKAIYTTSQKYDGEQSSELFMLLLSFGIAKLDNDTRARNVKARMITCAEKGQCLGKAPFGYKNVTYTHDGKITGRGVEFDSVGMPIVQHIFRMRGEGLMTMSNIAKICKQEYQSLVSFKFSEQSIWKMLKNPFYIGMLPYAGKIYKGKHDAIIPFSLYEKVEKLEHGYLHTGRDKKEGGVKNPPYLFKGRIFDSEGIALSGEIKKQKYIYYRHQSLRSSCKVNISEKYIEEKITERLKSFYIPSSQYPIFQGIGKQIFEERNKHISELLTQIRKNITEGRQKQDKLLQAFLEGIIDNETYKKKNLEIEKEIILLQSRKDEIDTKKFDDFEKKIKQMFELVDRLSERYISGDTIEKSTILRKCEFELVVDNKKELTIKESKLFSALRRLSISNGGPGGIRTPEVVDKGFTVLPIGPLWNRPILN